MTFALHTDRLILRGFRDEDAEPIARLIGNLDVACWLTHVPHPYALSDAQRFIAKEQETPGVTFAIELEGALVGAVSHGDILGYWIAISHWGNGYATEAAHALVTNRFQAGADTIISGYHLGNEGSRNVLTKLGFVPSTQESVYSKPLKRHVTLQRVILTRKAWQARA